MTIPNSVTSIGGNAFSDCVNLTSVTIPNSVTSIGSGAFEGCRGLTSVTIPNSVTSIGDETFRDCSGLTSVTIPNSVTSIGYETFRYCSSLTSVTIPNSVTSIGNSAFYGCGSLTSVTIGNSVTSIGYETFRDCSGLTSVTIPNSVTSIGKGAFNCCSGLENINVMPDNANYKSIDGILYNKDMTIIIKCPEAKTSVTIPNSVTSIGPDAFGWCRGLTSVTIPNSVTSIGPDAFGWCRGLTSVTIPNSVTSIGSGAFGGCRGLTYVTIPNSVTSIGEGAFYICDDLKSIYMQCEVPIECDPICGNNTLKEAILYVPKGTKTAYEKVVPWEYFWSIEEVENKVISISLPDAKDTLILGEEVTLNPIVEPDCATIRQLSYSSSDPNTVSCDGAGKLKAVGLGSATITISACDGSGVTIEHNVQVIESLSEIEGIENDNYAIFVRAYDGAISIFNKPDNSIVRVFTLQGSLIKETEDPEVKNLSKGIYVVTVEDRSFKVML